MSIIKNGGVDSAQKPLLAVPYEGTNAPPPFRRHIVAVGDLHGDYPNARKVLQFSGVTDDRGKWSGDIDVFVQTGDIIDRGDDTIKLFTWMDELREQAEAAGAVMLSHLGNHEWMNAIGDWRYVWKSEIKTFGSVRARQKMISSGPIGQSWAHNYTVATRLPLHPFLGPPNIPYPLSHTADTSPLSHSALSFVHGGLSPTYSNLSPFPSKINDLGTSLLHKLQDRVQPPPHPPHRYPGLPKDATEEEEELYSGDGPLWYRGWALNDDVCEVVDEVLNQTGTRRMIMGHTPDFHNIVSRCDGKIIIIDTGISHAYGGALSALDIQYELIPVAPIAGDDRSDWLYEERETVSAVYVDRMELIKQDVRQVVGNFEVLVDYD
ncbi:Metallo-dependent phosphatase [Fistulina hepatica ATCC 64428]|uniref:Metallo-dependent phosphatase n=1 Tax=Fistulina hepatica ATCC 64428 TaxID=1128425 RepID=A0A0D7AJ02_9AGAR|nr:Metallo-dependent phosphatase [Fistulina hepatica ATCC 64428]